MPASRRTIRIGALTAILFAAAVVWGVTVFDESRLKNSVEPIVDTHATENAGPGVEVASSVTVVRENLLWGVPHAKVEVYVRAENDTADGKITGIEYEYVFEDGEWRFTNSGACSGAECATRGMQAFAKLTP